MLWIITQNKKDLVNVKEVRVIDNRIEGVINRSFFVFWNKVLGGYNSNERATEIIKEIYEKLEISNTVTTFSMPEK
ncbi:hypothetical protein AWH56_011265 [Anaerobacillus isosaccharinicus]|uniref:Uncharacterized protein n=1 Tax=Anaerobacillus isosaccharinicus TaxID=1532552 RepID=A0A7S7RDJ0_9BACI|nr:hypothetical protein [Anaerobacillus isosaccharinicus]MBA5588516.1 hypothetical protein [Anaerobacillus isosaccharinicus]QOY38061.1 hypothetical protein AWH56_011265 [Anaerobacillus isosaccharinicus]